MYTKISITLNDSTLYKNNNSGHYSRLYVQYNIRMYCKKDFTGNTCLNMSVT